MRRTAAYAFSSVFVVAVLAGCGGKTAAPPAATTTASIVARLTDPADVQTCAQLQTNIKVVSELVSASVEVVTNAVHPQQLAQRTGLAQRNLLIAANFVATLDTPRSLLPARHRLVVGLHQFAADFGRARKSVARNDLPKAAQQLVDERALANLKAATTTIDRACGA